MKHIHYRIFEPGDEQAYLELFQKVYGKEKTLDDWRWAFQDNPHHSTVIRLAWHDDRLVGSAAHIPTTFYAGDREILAYQVVDLMVDPEYRKLKILQNLNAWCRIGMLNEGGTMKFGYPNTVSIPIGKRYLFWEHIFPIPVYTLYLSGLTEKLPSWLRPLAGLYEKRQARRFAGRSEELTATPVSVFSDEYSELFERVHPRYKFVIRKDRAYLDWRYHRKPNSSYRIINLSSDKLDGFLIYCVKNDTFRCVNLVELMAVDEQSEMQLLGAFLRNAVDEQVQVVRAWANPNGALARHLALMGFWKRKADIFQVIEVLTGDPAVQIARDPKAWHITRGDSDTL